MKSNRFVLDIGRLTLILIVALIVCVIAQAAIDVMLIRQIDQLKVAAAQPAVAQGAVEPTNKSLQHGLPFRMVIDSRSHPVHKLFQAGFNQACKDLDVLCDPILMDVVTLDEYVAKMETTVSLGSSGVVMNLGAPFLYKPGEDMAKAFPLISVHSKISKTDIPDLRAWVAADPVAYAKSAAAEMATKLSCAGPVADNQNAKSDTENAVGDTFRAEYIRLCPKAVVLETQMEGAEPTAAAAVDAAIIAAHPDLKGAFSTTGGGPTSWATALQEAGKKPGDIVVISMDYTLPNLTLLKSGWVYALVGQPLYEEYYQGVQMLLDILKGKTVAYDNVLPAPIIKVDQADKYIEINKRAGN
jgi:ribose transport system substrate-binding protein